MVSTPARPTQPEKIRSLYNRHPVDWVIGHPFWETYLQEQAPTVSLDTLAVQIESFRQPAILRFTHDTFMEDFLQVAATAPERLSYWRVQRETWRIPAPTPAVETPAATPSDDTPVPSDTASSPWDDLSQLTPEHRETLTEQEPIKLYQPANQRFYLVTANLVCRIPGLPDRTLHLNRGETVAFVVRRLIQRQASDNAVIDQEYAFINGTWVLIPVNEQAQQQVYQVYPGEERFPMFPVTYFSAREDHTRRLFAGLVPVSNREKFINAEIRDEAAPLGLDVAPAGPQTAPVNPVEHLLTLCATEVLEPWREVVSQFQKYRGAIDIYGNGLVDEEGSAIYPGIISASMGSSNPDQLLEAVKRQRDQLQLTSWYILLDFSSFLKSYLPSVWHVIMATPESLDADLPEAQEALLTALRAAQFEAINFETASAPPEEYYWKVLGGRDEGTIPGPSGSVLSLTDLLRTLESPIAGSQPPSTYRDFLESTTARYDTFKTRSAGETWPTGQFLLCGQHIRNLVDRERDFADARTADLPKTLGDVRDSQTNDMRPGLLRLALESQQSASLPRRLPLIPLAQQLSQSAVDQAEKGTDTEAGRFYIRCVFECPRCPPSLRQTVSDPSIQFQMASYFDPDAPARPIRIPLPVDTTPAGLRKFTKNTMFAVSDSLACQIELARKLTFGDLVRSVLPWPFHKDLPEPRAGKCKEKGIDIGKLCTLSIPIITICALILLIVIVLLLNYIFHWVPYLIYCLPLPGLKAKKGGDS
jgi:hypothetical protein